jgi:hypothetical protein
MGLLVLLVLERTLVVERPGVVVRARGARAALLLGVRLRLAVGQRRIGGGVARLVGDRRGRQRVDRPAGPERFPLLAGHVGRVGAGAPLELQVLANRIIEQSHRDKA